MKLFLALKRNLNNYSLISSSFFEQDKYDLFSNFGNEVILKYLNVGDNYYMIKTKKI